MKNPVSIIIAREYLERVKRKSFIITTILTPVVMLLLMASPTLVMMLGKSGAATVAVIDDSGVIAPELHDNESITFRTISGELADVRANEDYDAILVIDRDVVRHPEKCVNLYTRGASSMDNEMYITSEIEDAVEARRIASYNIDNLNKIMKDVQVDITIPTFRIDKDSEEDSATSSLLSYGLGMVMMMILYMFILLYGQMVMTSIIEEKNNRVLELVVSSVKPTSLMMGKLLGIGAVAVTQIVIWVALMFVGSLWLAPFLSSMASESDSTAVAGAISQILDPSFLTEIAVFMVLFLIGGYLLYSSIFAAIGSAVDNIQDASQLQTLAIVPILLALVVSLTVVKDPESGLAVWCSIIPFTSPMVMMARLPFGIPVWQEIVSVVVLYASFLGMIWLSAKIYRVGIFMYGKKPNVKELMRWITYK